MATKTSITVEDFVKMETAENEAYELVDGELIPLSSPTPLHSNVRGRLEYLIRSFFANNPLGGTLSETDCLISADTLRRPDLSIILGVRWLGLDLEAVPLPFAPDIAVEVFSPSEHVVDVNRQVKDYLKGGSQEVWLLDPENIELHIRTNNGIRLLLGHDSLESPLLPGFTVHVETLLSGR